MPHPVIAPPTTRAARPSFAAMQNPGYRAHFTTYVLAMMASNIEHVISYWMAFQKFHSPALAGFAVISIGHRSCCSRWRPAPSPTASIRAA